MTREGASLSVDSAQLVTSLFALLPIPVAIVDDSDRIVISNSFFNEVFPGSKSLQGTRLHEILAPGCGTFGVDVSKEVSLRRQITQLERRSQHTVRPEAERVPCDLNELIRAVAREREQYTKAARIVVSMDLSAALPKVKGDPEDLSKVLLGLLTNAEQAIVFAGRRFGAIHIKTWVENDYVRLSFCDNGCGISTRDIYGSSIEPLLRDGSRARPLGMGLCAEIIKDYGGELFCWSSYDAGSTYTMELPSVAIATEPRNPAANVDAERFAGKSILVVDDDVHLTELMFDVLARHGAKVELADTNRQATQLVQGRRFDVIICDRSMAGLLKPGVFQRFIFVTADAVNAQTRRFFAQAGVEFIRRPFHIDDLMSTIEALLNQQPPHGS
jgi:nitrogen-specific signal transduction histidine kinase